MDAGYFDLDDILAEQQRLSGAFRIQVPDMGFLESRGEQHLLPNVKVDLPFWLMSSLAEKDLVALDPPKCFNQQVRDDIVADPAAVNLHARNPYFYEFGLRVVDLMLDKELHQTLERGFRGRLGLIMDIAKTPNIRIQLDEFAQSLDETERELLMAGQVAATAAARWQSMRKGCFKVRG
ncbi:hypothetical protein BJ742DRAFT_835442 [Cladochytrium replicatum]|nr:hypothetical protein BJ742DRAFT_835442 [Cladochytrium replicatum]